MSSNTRRRDDLDEYWFEKIAVTTKVLKFKIYIYTKIYSDLRLQKKFVNIQYQKIFHLLKKH